MRYSATVRSVPENSSAGRWIRAARERQRGQAEACRPSLGPVVQPSEALVRKVDASGGQQLVRLLDGERQLLGSDLRQVTGDPEPLQAQAQVAAHNEQQAQLRHAEQRAQAVRRRPCGEPIETVDDEQNRRADLTQALGEPSHAVDPGDRGAAGAPGSAPGERNASMTAVQNRVASHVPGLDRGPGCGTFPRALPEPCVDQRRLAAARRPRHEGHGALRAALERAEET